MGNKFDIVLSATDKASAVFRTVNNAADRLARPFNEAGKSFKRLGRELGFQRIGRDLRDIGRHATSTASSVASVVAPMAALTGIGSIAGVAALADNWSRLGRATSNAAGNIGISTQELQSFQGMGQLAGMSADQATGSLQGLANTLQNAQWGRDNGALMLLNRLGVGIKHTASGAVDASGEFMALATAISKIKNPQAQMIAAGKFSMTEWLPLIRQGPQAMRELQARAESLGLVMSTSGVRAATDFANSLDNLQGAGQGLKNSVMEQLTPAIKPLTDGLANWIVQNRELIATDVGAWARDFAQWVKSIDWKGVNDGIHGFIDGVHDVVDALGGWKNAALVTIGVMNAGLIASVVGLAATLARGGVGIALFTGMLWKWARAGKAARAATLGAAAAGDVLDRASKGGKGGGVNSTALGLIGLGLTATQLSGDQSDGSRDAQRLQFEAMSGNQEAAQQLARIQLTHWWSKDPTKADIDARALEISSGRQAGMTPAQVGALNPQRAAAQQRLGQLEGKYHLPPGLLDAIWKQESGRGTNMLSPAGAQGHFGFMPATAKAYGLTNPMDFDQSSDASARMFRDLFKQYGGDTTKALAAYNWGSGNLANKGLGAAPAETRNYIRDVSAALSARQAEEKASAPAGPTPAAAPAAAPSGPYSAPVQATEQTLKHEFELTFHGLPSGVSPVVKSRSGAPVTGRIGYSTLEGIA